MTKQRGFWLGIAIGFIAGFLYGWLSISAAYMELEREYKEREAELEQVKRIIYASEDILSQRKDIFDWNRWAIRQPPELIVAEEEQ